MDQQTARATAQEKANATGIPHYVGLWWDAEEQTERFSVHASDPGAAYPLEEVPQEVERIEPQA